MNHDGPCSQIAPDGAAIHLREALVLAQTADIIGSPISHDRLLEMIVKTAATAIGARAALLFVVDRQRGELIYEVSVRGGVRLGSPH